tara:strand:+ start:254 stop:664 length:411 start_codon:yes stop_codon:yes gene_type:complete
MSEILVNKLTGTSTAGSILVTGEGNSTTTNLQQGLAKAWVNFNGSTFGINDSFNVGSMTDNSTGDYTVTFSNALSSANFSTTANTLRISGDQSSVVMPTAYTTAKVELETWRENAGAGSVAADHSLVSASISGDLA